VPGSCSFSFEGGSGGGTCGLAQQPNCSTNGGDGGAGYGGGGAAAFLNIPVNPGQVIHFNQCGTAGAGRGSFGGNPSFNATTDYSGGSGTSSVVVLGGATLTANPGTGAPQTAHATFQFSFFVYTATGSVGLGGTASSSDPSFNQYAVNGTNGSGINGGVAGGSLTATSKGGDGGSSWHFTNCNGSGTQVGAGSGGSGSAGKLVLKYNVLVASTPTVPIIPQLTYPYLNRVFVNWQADASATSYTLRYKLAPNGTYTVIPSITGTSYTVNGLTLGSTYIIEVAAVNSSGTGPYGNSNTTIVQPPSLDPVGMSNFTTNTAVVIWHTIPGVDAYHVDIIGFNSGYTLSQDTSTSPFIYDVADMYPMHAFNPGENYIARVVSIVGSDRSTFYDSGVIPPPEYTP
jgi:hypothetical protein